MQNLVADPAVVVEIGGDVRNGYARILDRGEEVERARALVFDKDAPRSSDDLTGWRTRALPVAIELGDE